MDKKLPGEQKTDISVLREEFPGVGYLQTQFSLGAWVHHD